jgi:hypothetical protein
MLGVVLNRIPRDSYYYGGYHHYYESYKGQYYYRHADENQPQLVEANQAIKLLPKLESQTVEYYVADQSESPENVDNVFQPRMPVEVYMPPNNAPATLDIITKPRKRNEGLRVTEEATYVIQKHHLEYWYDDEDR